jgi:hypothetical protein
MGLRSIAVRKQRAATERGARHRQWESQGQRRRGGEADACEMALLLNEARPHREQKRENRVFEVLPPWVLKVVNSVSQPRRQPPGA